MGQKENNLKNKHDRTLTKWQRLIRVNSGMAWAGTVVSKVGNVLTLKNFYPFFGAEAGVSDQIGFDSVLITPDMVPPEGLRVAVFVACELKAGRDQLKPKQIDFKNMVVSMGGIHREVRDDETIQTDNLFKTLNNLTVINCDD